jgi:hypothetical protein
MTAVDSSPSRERLSRVVELLRGVEEDLHPTAWPVRPRNRGMLPVSARASRASSRRQR